MASNLRIAQANQAEVLLYSTDRDISGLFVQAEIRDEDDNDIDTINLTESSGISGTYTGSFTFTSTGTFSVIYIPYTDSGHTIESERAPRASEVFQVRFIDDAFIGARMGATGIVDDDIKLIVKTLKKELDKKPKENIGEILEELLDKKLKIIDFKPRIEVKTPDIIVKPTPVTVKPIVKVAAPIVNPTPVTVKPIINPTPVIVKPIIKPTPVIVKPTPIKIEAPIVKPTPVIVKPIINPTPVNINLGEIKIRQDKQEEILKNIARDIENIKQKEGIVGTSKRIFNELMS